MFKRSVNFLHQLVGGASKKGASGEERRVRVRYPSQLEVQFHSLNGSTRPLLSARVRDISRGGVSLVMPQPFELGEMLSIELPGTEERPLNLALACVVHATVQPNGDWVVGCTFSHQLSDDDLRPFGARREKPASRDDARAWERFPVQVKAECQEAAVPNQEPWPVQVLNLSANGIGLLASRSVEPGTLLALTLHREGTAAGQNILACVVHVTTREDGDRVLGCNFIRELTDKELKALL